MQFFVCIIHYCCSFDVSHRCVSSECVVSHGIRSIVPKASNKENVREKGGRGCMRESERERFEERERIVE